MHYLIHFTIEDVLGKLVEYFKLLIAAAVPNAVSLLEQINIAPRTWYAGINLAMLFSLSQ